MRWGRGGGVGAAAFRTAPRPLAFARPSASTRTVSMGTQNLDGRRGSLEILGYDQPRDSQVHGVDLVRVRGPCRSNCSLAATIPGRADWFQALGRGTGSALPRRGALVVNWWWIVGSVQHKGRSERCMVRS